MEDDTKYKYVDVWALKAGQPRRWRRLVYGGDDYARWLTSNEGCDLFATLQRFALQRRTDDELYITPFALDLDGPEALADARKVVTWLEEALGCEDATRIWFSGSKGFHITVAAQALGMEPSSNTHEVMKAAASFLMESLEAPSIDLKVYQSRHVWRIPGTKHSKSGLYKTEIEKEDLLLDIDEIKGMCTEPTQNLEDEYDGPEHSDWFREFVSDEGVRRHHARVQPVSNVLSDDTEGFPDCIKDVESEFHRNTGDRNRANFFLATYYADRSIPQRDAEFRLADWAGRIPAHLSSASQQDNIASAKSTVRSVYTAGKGRYHFSCGAIRSLGTPDNPVACPGETNCKFVNADLATRKKVVDVSLEEALLPEYRAANNIRVNVASYLGSRGDSPVSVPAVARIKCEPNDAGDYCKACPLQGDDRLVGIDTDSGFNLALYGLPKEKLADVLRSCAGIPRVGGHARCKRAAVRVEEERNIWLCAIQPHVDFHGDAEVSYRKNTAYILSDKVRANRRYALEGVSLAHPKSGEVVHVIDKVSELKTIASAYEYTDKNHNRLRSFQGDPFKKMAEIHQALEDHVHGIRKRRALAVMADLTAHSLIHIHFRGKKINRGWIESAVVGDTDQGKTTLIRRMLDHYGVGQIVSLEGATEAGLTGAAVKFGDAWMVEFGAFCRNDKGIVVCDEVQNAPEFLLERLNSVREDGKASVEKAAKAESAARCRKIWVGNPPMGRGMTEFSYGVNALKGLFKQDGAVRRLDMAIGVKKEQHITESIYEELPEAKASPWIPQDFQLLIHWAWTREAKHLAYDEGVETYINTAAVAMLDKYCETEIPLVSSGSQAIKISRVAIAVAARLYSTIDGRTLVVKKEHVDYAVQLMNTLYDDPALNYGGWSARKNKLNRFSEEDYQRAMALIRQRFVGDASNFVHFLNETEWFNKTQLIDEWYSSQDVGLKKQYIEEIIGFMKQNNLIERTVKGSMYRKTAKGIKIMRRMIEENFGSPKVKEAIDEALESVATELTQEQIDELWKLDQ